MAGGRVPRRLREWAGRPRVRGLPPSPNGASSLHLWWELCAGEPVTEVAATVEVIGAPAAPRAYFWALQASFHDGSQAVGAGHLGLQWGVGRPPRRCVNWGGYHAGGSELDGTRSHLPSALGDANTVDFPWLVGRPYRLRIHPSPAGGGLWRGEVTDADGRLTVVRDLRSPGRHLVEPVVWSEVFARCDDPSVTVRWSDLEAMTASGRRVPASAAVAGYQRRDQGGCDNTTSDVDAAGWLQRTNTDRRHGAGARLPRP